MSSFKIWCGINVYVCVFYPFERAFFCDFTAPIMFASQVLISDDDKKRREKRQRIVHTNVATALLAILKSIRPYAESEYNVDVPWVSTVVYLRMCKICCISGCMLQGRER